ncbi:metal-sensitive transcriptional regulator [Prosthecochloris vibrioformis]|uniref:Metal-sensitive transcriptional regulator n=1 Tax=Prosthecochloris vibrioformis TaxID=1098 RepID=A0A5C4RZ47_PROVB|nr:metal-sensitive transcriptional regulator [Prosthecochloris vibrioformis]TNJ36315.1 metal-sensitive transcriptional regulator [Prosthecochloris vibrioformis]
MDGDIILRLKKVNGQIQGLMRMMEDKERCDKVIVQFQAAKAALDTTYSMVLQSSLHECMSRHDDENMDKILKLISKE